MNEIPDIDIRPYSSMSLMLSAFNDLKLNNKEWSAADWGQVGDLTNYTVKAPLLADWIRLIKILKTLEEYAKENDYRADRVGYQYCVIIHTNGYYIGPPSYSRKAYEAVNEVYLPLNQLRVDLEDTTKTCFTWFFVWNLEEHTCPEAFLHRIFQKCRSIAEEQ